MCFQFIVVLLDSLVALMSSHCVAQPCPLVGQQFGKKCRKGLFEHAMVTFQEGLCAPDAMACHFTFQELSGHALMGAFSAVFDVISVVPLIPSNVVWSFHGSDGPFFSGLTCHCVYDAFCCCWIHGQSRMPSKGWCQPKECCSRMHQRRCAG